MEVISPMAYQLQLPDTYKGHNVLNIQHLTKYHRSPCHTCLKLANPRDALPSTEEYEVEQIVGEKWKNGKLYYRIRWKGYDATDNTWQSAQDICNTPELLKAWRNRLWCQAQLGRSSHAPQNVQVIKLISLLPHLIHLLFWSLPCRKTKMSTKQHESTAHRISFWSFHFLPCLHPAGH